MLTLSRPIFDGPRRIDSVEVRLPPPTIDLARPPRGSDELQVRWRISKIVDLPLDAVRQIAVDDCEAIVEAHGELVGQFRAAAKAIRR